MPIRSYGLIYYTHPVGLTRRFISYVTYVKSHCSYLLKLKPALCLTRGRITGRTHTGQCLKENWINSLRDELISYVCRKVRK